MMASTMRFLTYFYSYISLLLSFVVSSISALEEERVRCIKTNIELFFDGNRYWKEEDTLKKERT